MLRDIDKSALLPQAGVVVTSSCKTVIPDGMEIWMPQKMFFVTIRKGHWMVTSCCSHSSTIRKSALTLCFALIISSIDMEIVGMRWPM